MSLLPPKLPVLILVLVEDGLGACNEATFGDGSPKVLILVLVEDGLGALTNQQAKYSLCWS